MQREDETDSGSNKTVDRRDFLKSTGALAALGVTGAAASDTAAAEKFDDELLNWRGVEARKVWDRGYRGRPDRTLALTDSPADQRHPDLGPWNDVVLEGTDSGFDLKELTEVENIDVYTREAGTKEFGGARAGAGALGFFEFTNYFLVPDQTITPKRVKKRTFSGVVAGAIGVGAAYEGERFALQDGSEQVEATDPDHRVNATLTWEPSNPQGTEAIRVEFELRDASGNTVASSDAISNFISAGERAERRIVTDDVEPGNEYYFYVTPGRGGGEFEIESTTEVIGDSPRDPDTKEEDRRGFVSATLSYNIESPDAQPGRLQYQLQNADGETVKSAGPGLLAIQDDNTVDLRAKVEPGLYRFRVTTWRGAAKWNIDTSVRSVIKEGRFDESSEKDVAEEFTVYPTEPLSDDTEVIPSPDGVTLDTPKLVGFYNEARRYLGKPVPNDPIGHGSHVASIMTGTGQGSSIDYNNTTAEEPRAVLAPTEFIEYGVEAGAGETVFASALGEGVVVEIVYDDEVIHQAPLREDSTIADEPAVHDSGTATYTVRVRPFETDDGTPAAGRLNKIAYGTYVTTYTDDVLGERTDNSEDSMHAGIAPNASLVSLEGLVAPAADLTSISEDLAEKLNVRAINMSWGPLGGVPLGQAGVFSASLDGIRVAAQNGILTVAAAGNSWTPANGNGAPAVAAEAISVVATGPLDGITSYSSGGIGGRDQDDSSFNAKPDVMAPGGDIEPDSVAAIATGIAGAPYPVPSRVELVRAALAPGSSFDDGSDVPTSPRDHVSIGGTSMASPYTCGTAGLVAQAMEEDAPDSIALSEPGDAEIEDTLRLKQTVLATASETAFTAAPYHAAKNVPSTPTYEHGDRDPYEGYGRVNPDAAVDAVSRNLLGDGKGDDPALGDETYEVDFEEEAVGTNIPVDSRAVAGYVDVPGGSLDVSVDFTGYTGGNRGLAKGDPHLDLFVYDAENPGENGEPNIVTSVRGVDGTGSVSVSVDRGSRDDKNRDTYYVVAKIVNIPGVVNGYDVQANFDLGVSFDPANEFQPKKVNLNVSGSRSDDGDAFTGGQTNRVEVTVEDFNDDLADAVTVSDEVPDGWSVDERYGDIKDTTENDDGSTTVDLGTVSASDVGDDSNVTRTYFAEAPDGATETGTYTFGPAEAVAVSPKTFETDDSREKGSTKENFGGTDSATVVGQSSETDN